MCCHIPRFPPTWRSHPIFSLRRWAILNAIVGFLMCIVCIANTYEQELYPIWALCIVILGLSFMLSVIDLTVWASEKKDGGDKSKRCKDCKKRLRTGRTSNIVNAESQGFRNASRREMSINNDSNGKEQEAHWPKNIIMILDFVFGGLFIWSWMAAISAAAWSRGYYVSTDLVIFRSYTTLTLLVGCIVHFKCWWKELMARKRTKWVRELVERGERIRSLKLTASEVEQLLPTNEIHVDAQNSNLCGIHEQPRVQCQTPSAREEVRSKWPFSWPTMTNTANKNDDVTQAGPSDAQRLVSEENQKILAELTPTATGSTDKSSSAVEEASSSDEEAIVNQRYGYGSILDSSMMSSGLVTHGRCNDRSVLRHPKDIIDEEQDGDGEGNDTLGAAGADKEAAVIVKKKKNAKKEKGKSKAKGDSNEI